MLESGFEFLDSRNDSPQGIDHCTPAVRPKPVITAQPEQGLDELSPTVYAIIFGAI